MNNEELIMLGKATLVHLQEPRDFEDQDARGWNKCLASISVQFKMLQEEKAEHSQ